MVIRPSRCRAKPVFTLAVTKCDCVILFPAVNLPHTPCLIVWRFTWRYKTNVCGFLTFGFGFLLFGGAWGRRAVLRRLLLRLPLGRLLFLLLLVILSVRTCGDGKRWSLLRGVCVLFLASFGTFLVVYMSKGWYYATRCECDQLLKAVWKYAFSCVLVTSQVGVST